MKKILFFVLFIMNSFLFYGCSQNSPPPSAQELTSFVGSEMVIYVTLANEISVAIIKPQLKVKSLDEIQVVGNEKTIEQKELRSLKKVLINDDNYQFELTKKNIFVPDLLIKFPNKEFFILVDRNAKQVKFFFPNGKKILDIDPSASKMIDLFDSFTV